MTTMRAVHVGGRVSKVNRDLRLGVWVFLLGVAVVLLAAPLAMGQRSALQWTWPIGAGLLFVSIRGIGGVADERLGRRDRVTREDTVGPWLERLGGKAHVLRYVEAGGRSIEYVIVAPSGVYAMRTRNHRGKVTSRDGELLVNGRPLAADVLAAARGESYALEERLGGLGFSYPVRPLIVFTEARLDVRQAGDVTALPVRWLESYVRRSPTVMSPIETALVAGALRRDSRASTVR